MSDYAGRSHQWLLTLLIGIQVVASCDPPAARQVQITTSPSIIARSTPPEHVPLPVATQLGYHRYVGTIGGQSVLAEFTLWLEKDSAPNSLIFCRLKSSFYYRATGMRHMLGEAAQFHPAQWLETYSYDVSRHNHTGVVAILCAEQPPGGVLLTGRYMPTKWSALPICLRESYADGVRYELLNEQSYGPARRNDQGKLDSALVQQVYLHLLGPDTLRTALARLQCPPPAARRRARLRRAAHLSPNGYYRDFLNITLNESSLLAYTHDVRQGIYGRRYDLESSRCYLFDLRTGHPLSLASQLRPGGLRQLQRLLSRQALNETATARQRNHWWDAGQLQLPDAGFEINPIGCRAYYSQPEYEQDSYAYAQTLNWVQLRPLVRPASLLNQLLRIRGL